MTFLFGSRTAAQTLLLSSELCHVALPKGRGFGATSFGFVSGLRKCVMISNVCPKIVWNRVASGRAPLTVQDAVDAPTAVGRQTYFFFNDTATTEKRELPVGGVIPVGVTGGVSPCAPAPGAMMKTHP